MALTLSGARAGAVRRPWPAARAVPLLVAGAVALLGALYFLARRPVLPLADATIYVTGAQALALGHGYRLLGYLAEPPSTMYPPGYSLLLAPLFKLWPNLFLHFPILELTSLLAFFALLGLSALALRRCFRASTTDTALAVLLAATTPMALLMSTAVLSDTWYGAVVLAGLLLVHVGRERPGRRGLAYLAAGALLVAFAYYLRTVGIALVAALALDSLRRARHAPWSRTLLGLLPIALIVPWSLWTTASGGVGYFQHMAKGIPGQAPALDSPEALLVVVLGHLVQGSEVLWAVAPALINDRPELRPVLPVGALWPLAWLAAAVLHAYVLWQSAWRWWREQELAHLFVLLYLGMLLLNPGANLGRYIWPIAPIVAWYLIVGVRQVWALIGPRLGASRVPLDRVVVALLLVANCIWLAAAARDAAAGAWIVDARYGEELLAMRQVADHLNGLEPAGAPLATNHLTAAPWWHVYTGRQGVDAVARADGAEPYYAQASRQGDPSAVAYFVYHRDNGRFLQQDDDLPSVRAALAARGASTEPLYCANDGSICVYDWRPRPTPP